MEDFQKIREEARLRTLNSASFLNILKSSIPSLIENCSKANSEATVRQVFNSFFRDILREGFHIEYSPELEFSVNGDYLTRFRGKVDAIYGNLIIEFKLSNKYKTEKDQLKAREQLLTYIRQIKNKNQDSEWFGYVTDGVNIESIYYSKDGATSFSGVRRINVDTCKNILNVIIEGGKIALTPQNLINFLSSDNGKDSPIKALAKVLYQTLRDKSTGKSLMLFQEWKSIFHLAHEDNSKQEAIAKRKRSLSEYFNLKETENLNNQDEYEALFALQTAYAITVKIIANHVLEKARGRTTVDWSLIKSSDSLFSYIKSVESGVTFNQEGLYNLIEYDYFSWYATERQWNTDLSLALLDILETLARFSGSCALDIRLLGDIFKELYQSVIPSSVRHCMGEYYTPGWLADHTITQALSSISVKEWRALDPCCGSGTFIAALITRVLEETVDLSNEDRLRAVLSRVMGFDLNPLAALSARINYFLFISGLLPERPIQVEIPIYMGDASYVPKKLILNGTECYQYYIRTEIKELKITLPKSIIQDLDRLSQAVVKMEDLLLLEDQEGLFLYLFQLLKEEDRSNVILIEELRELSEELVELQKKNWNGIWARIICNFYSTIGIGKFDIIVGNPPWIDWKNLPNTYRDRIKSICIEKGLFSGDSVTGGINLNICALITHVSITNWLEPNGTLAFLMPENLIFQQTYEGFRRLHINEGDYYIQKLYNWEKSGKPFDPVGIRFLTYIISRDFVNYSKGVEVISFIKQKGQSLRPYASSTSFKDISHIFEEKHSLVGTVHQTRTGFSYADSREELNRFRMLAGISSYTGREGIEFFPQELLLFNYVRQNAEQNLVMKNVQVSKSKYRIPQMERIFEPTYIRPLVKGVQIERFHFCDEPTKMFYVPFPYIRETSCKLPISSKELAEKSPKLFRYFQEHKEIFKRQTAYNDRIIGQDKEKEFYSLARVGNYSFAEVFVAFRDNTSWQACVITRQPVPWQKEEVVPVFQNRAAYISQDEKGHYISLHEAHYICAIMNAPCVQKYILNSSDSRTFKVRPPVHIPAFNSKNRIHVRLAKLSKLAHENYDNEYMISRIDKLLDRCLYSERTQIHHSLLPLNI